MKRGRGSAPKIVALIVYIIVILVATPQAQQQPQRFPSSAGELLVETVASGLEHAWGLAFLPDGGMLVTERPGRLRLVTPQGQLSRPLTGLPNVAGRGQGGLLDIVVDPRFAENRLVYFSFSAPASAAAG